MEYHPYLLATTTVVSAFEVWWTLYEQQLSRAGLSSSNYNELNTP